MITLRLQFPARRYHGTPWGRHVNEGVPEWPPSPYRLLRALYDSWQRKCQHLPADRVRDLFTALGSTLPVFRIPKAVAAHTRSYLSSNTEDPTDKSLIFDAFVSLAPGAACYIQWPIGLTADQHATLAELLSALNYLGRSESWIDATVADGAPPDLMSCVPAGSEGASGELVYIACPVAPGEYSGKRPWFDALTYSTSEMLKQRRSGPPAMRQVPYVRDPEAVATWLSPRTRASCTRISAVTLALTGRILPLATETVRIAERLRAAIMSKIGSEISGSIHGKDGDGRPLTSHQHLFILPRANQGKINRILLFCRRGFSNRELDGIRSVRFLPGFMDDYPYRVTVTWAGAYDNDEFRTTASQVISTTPFITVRHWRKGRGEVKEFLIEEVRRECRNHNLPEPIAVEEARLNSPFVPVRFRRNRRDDPPRPGYAFRIRFPEPVRVPFSLGYGCHFGLGQFDRED
jgi:CRISPR-associated protein Csb2